MKNLENILSALVFSVLSVLCLSFVAIRVLGLGTFIVTGGSMEPSIHKGSLVVVQPVSPSVVKVGDVITFQQYGQTTTHRVIAIGPSDAGLTFKTQGDANTVADPEDKYFPGQVGIVRISVPVVGMIAGMSQALWRLLLTLIAAITFFGCAGALVWNNGGGSSKAPIHAGVAARPISIATRRPVLVPVNADEAWSQHVEWLRASHRKTMVA